MMLHTSGAALSAPRDEASAARSAERGAKVPDEATRKAASEFEAMFLAQMLAPMFEGLDSGGYFGGGPAEGLYRDLLVEEYGKVLARAGGVGIADSLARDMMKMQEA